MHIECAVMGGRKGRGKLRVALCEPQIIDCYEVSCVVSTVERLLKFTRNKAKPNMMEASWGGVSLWLPNRAWHL